MTDIESRLRTAMRSVGERPPAGLLDGIRARHRRRVWRLTAASAALAITVAVGAPSIVRALQRTGPRAAPAESPRSNWFAFGATVAPPAAAPGTVLSGCPAANPGRVDWNSHSAGRLGTSPLWYLSGGHSSGSRQLYAGLMVVAGLDTGSTVVVRVAPLSQLRFLFGPADSLSPGTRYTSSSGETGVTFVACPPGAGTATEPGDVTVYAGGFLAPAGRCVPVEVWWSGRHAPVRAGLGACGGPG